MRRHVPNFTYAAQENGDAKARVLRLAQDDNSFGRV
jgi:hypothetical protein